MFYRGLVLATWQGATTAGNGQFAEVFLIDTGLILDQVIVPDTGAGGPRDFGIRRLAQCKPAQAEAIRRAVEQGARPPIYEADGAWVLVSPIANTSLYFISHVLPHPRVVRKPFSAIAEKPVLDARQKPLSFQGEAVSIEYPEGVEDEERDIWGHYWLQGFDYGAAARGAGVTQMSDEEIENMFATAGDCRWNTEDNVVTFEGKAWIAGYKAAYKAQAKVDARLVDGPVPENREGTGAEEAGGGAESALPQSHEDEYFELNRIRIIVRNGGLLIDLRDSEGVLKVQGACDILAGGASLRIAGAEIEMKASSQKISAQTIEITAPVVKVQGAVQVGGGLAVAGGLSLGGASVSVSGAQGVTGPVIVLGPGEAPKTLVFAGGLLISAG